MVKMETKRQTLLRWKQEDTVDVEMGMKRYRHC